MLYKAETVPTSLSFPSHSARSGKETPKRDTPPYSALVVVVQPGPFLLMPFYLGLAPSHDAFRYPILKDNKRSFPDQHYINVRALGEEMNEIWNLFFGISNELAERIKNTPSF